MLGAGADDLILLCARCFAGPGDTIAIPEAPTYPLYRIAAQLARRRGRRRRPGRSPSPAGRTAPTGRSVRCPRRGRSSVDEAYFEYCGETAVPLLDDGVIVLRTFSKAFALAGARIGYALAARERRRRAERAPGARARLDALGGARDRRARLAARRRGR